MGLSFHSPRGLARSLIVLVLIRIIIPAAVLAPQQVIVQLPDGVGIEAGASANLGRLGARSFGASAFQGFDDQAAKLVVTPAHLATVGAAGAAIVLVVVLQALVCIAGERARDVASHTGAEVACLLARTRGGAHQPVQERAEHAVLADFATIGEVLRGRGLVVHDVMLAVGGGMDQEGVKGAALAWGAVAPGLRAAASGHKVGTGGALRSAVRALAGVLSLLQPALASARAGSHPMGGAAIGEAISITLDIFDEVGARRIGEWKATGFCVSPG